MRGGGLWGKAQPVDPHWPRNVLQALLAGIDEVCRYLALHLPPDI